MRQRLKRAFTWPLMLLVIIWIVFLLDSASGSDWFIYGIAPRKTFALRGIFTAPFLHGDWAHLLSNTPPFFVLMAMILYFYPRVAIPVLTLIYLGTGALMWALADPEALFAGMSRVNYHIGASGVVYGMATFLATTGIVRRNIRSIAIALIIVFYYGGLIWGVLPIKEGVSWEGHLLGAVVGIFAAYWFRHRIEDAERKQVPSYELEEDDPRPFLPRDVFDQRK